jgi:hypothetical protein
MPLGGEVEGHDYTPQYSAMSADLVGSLLVA